MNATLFRRMTASFIDLCLVAIVVYGLFFIGGRGILQNRVDNFDILNSDYSEIIEGYNADLSAIQTEYDAAIQLANQDEDLITLAQTQYNLKKAILNSQNTIDIEPYNRPLTQYFSEIIYFFVIGFIVLITVLSLATVGKTPGRRIMQVKLMVENIKGEYVAPGLLPIFLHDIFLKYFFIVLVFVFNMYYGLMFMLVALMIDILLISFTKNRTTIRDYFTRLKVLKSTYGY